MAEDKHAHTTQTAELWHTILDVIEPIAPLVAQGLHVLQPFARLFNVGERCATWAETLETADGVNTLRQQLTPRGGAYDKQ